MDGRDASAGSRLDIDEILNDLYASEINASDFMDLGWRLQVILSDPQQAEGWAFPTIGEAVAW